MTKGQRWSRVFVVHILDFIYRRNGGSGALASTRIPVRLCRLHLGFLDWAALQPEPDPRCKERPERGKVRERLQQRKRQHVKNMIEEQKKTILVSFMRSWEKNYEKIQFRLVISVHYLFPKIKQKYFCVVMKDLSFAGLFNRHFKKSGLKKNLWNT